MDCLSNFFSKARAVWTWDRSVPIPPVGALLRGLTCAMPERASARGGPAGCYPKPWGFSMVFTCFQHKIPFSHDITRLFSEVPPKWKRPSIWAMMDPLIDLIVWILVATSQWFIRCSSAFCISFSCSIRIYESYHTFSCCTPIHLQSLQTGMNTSMKAAGEAKLMGLFVVFRATSQSGTRDLGALVWKWSTPKTTGLVQFSIPPKYFSNRIFL